MINFEEVFFFVEEVFSNFEEVFYFFCLKITFKVNE